VTRPEALAWALATALTLAAPGPGAAAFALLGLLPLLPPRPATRASLGPALVTGVILSSGWLGLAIFQVTRRYATPWTEHLAVLCALAGLTAAAARFGAEDDPPDARALPLLRFLRAGLATTLAVLLLVAVRYGRAGFETSRATFALDAAARGIAGATFFGLFLERRASWAALRGAPWHLGLVAACALLLAAVRSLHGPP
jgi:hypothetical protein